MGLVGNLRDVGGFEHRHDWHALGVGGRDALEVRRDAAKFCIYECIQEIQVPIEPYTKAILDLVVNRERDLGAVGPDLGEIDQADDLDISAG